MTTKETDKYTQPMEDALREFSGDIKEEIMDAIRDRLETSNGDVEDDVSEALQAFADDIMDDIEFLFPW